MNVIPLYFAQADAVKCSVVPLVLGIFVAVVLSALDIFLPRHGALDK